MTTEVIRKTRNEVNYFAGMAFDYDKRKRFLLYLFPFFIVDTNANLWTGTYEKRRNEISPLGRHGSLWQRFGTRSPVFKVSGKMNFENIITKWLPYIKLIGTAATRMNADQWFDPRVVKFILEYIWQADAPMLMQCDLDTSIVVLDKMEWKQIGEEQLSYAYTLELVEVRPIPIVVKAPLNIFTPDIGLK